MARRRPAPTRHRRRIAELGVIDVAVHEDGRPWLQQARALRDEVLPHNNRSFWDGYLDPYGRLVAAVANDEVVGYLLGEITTWDTGHAVVMELGVQPERQRTGIGTMLLNRFATMVEQAGCRWIYVKALPGERRRPLLRYYAERGFTKREAEQGYQRAPPSRVIAATSGGG